MDVIIDIINRGNFFADNEQIGREAPYRPQLFPNLILRCDRADKLVYEGGIKDAAGVAHAGKNLNASGGEAFVAFCSATLCRKGDSGAWSQ